MNPSTLKTALKRKGFKHVGYGSNDRMSIFHNSWVCKGRVFRFRNGTVDYDNTNANSSGWVPFKDKHLEVDICVDAKDFDRWANSSDSTVLVSGNDLDVYGLLDHLISCK